ncbi:hypothetical protein [Streptomyces ziwulingensis]|uniref:Uncharacterized protein n=1 Tax=Streptomyces ziwulingensis TaxID=1045501 RepID=A0ABP9D7F0_9ACTN
MLEINGQRFQEGDVVRFERAGLPKNRTRDYTITAVTGAGIEASAGGFSYGFTKATATRIGITHSPTSRNED